MEDERWGLRHMHNGGAAGVQCDMRARTGEADLTAPVLGDASTDADSSDAAVTSNITAGSATVVESPQKGGKRGGGKAGKRGGKRGAKRFVWCFALVAVDVVLRRTLLVERALTLWGLCGVSTGVPVRMPGWEKPLTPRNPTRRCQRWKWRKSWWLPRTRNCGSCRINSSRPCPPET